MFTEVNNLRGFFGGWVSYDRLSILKDGLYVVNNDGNGRFALIEGFFMLIKLRENGTVLELKLYHEASEV